MRQRGKTIIAFILSAAFIITGIIKEQNRQVFVKAIKICLECIGLG